MLGKIPCNYPRHSESAPKSLCVASDMAHANITVVPRRPGSEFSPVLHNSNSINSMSAKIETQGQLQGKRIEANCKTIWGSHKDFDFDMETDDWEHYCCVVKEDRGLSFGPPLTMTSLCHGSERAWNELDRMLCLWAKQVSIEYERF